MKKRLGPFHRVYLPLQLKLVGEYNAHLFLCPLLKETKLRRDRKKQTAIP